MAVDAPPRGLSTMLWAVKILAGEYEMDDELAAALVKLYVDLRQRRCSSGRELADEVWQWCGTYGPNYATTDVEALRIASPRSPTERVRRSWE